MPYPREIYLDSETEERLRSYLEDELNNHYAERGAHIEDLMRWQKDYWAKPASEALTFPFQGAASIIIPLSAIAIEAVHARNMTTRFGFPQLVTAESLSPDWETAERPVERFFDREVREVMKIRKPMGDCYLEATKFGTMIGKAGYERLVKTAVRSVGEREEEFDVVVKDGAEFDAVSDARFLMPHAEQDPQTAPWCGEEHSASPYEVQMLERGGLFRPGTIIDQPGAETDPLKQGKIRAWITSSTLGTTGQEGGKRFERVQQTLENTQPAWPKTLDWVELWLAFDVDGSGRDKEIVVHYHRASKTFMSIRYNWNADLRRPYRTGVYYPIEHRWRGIGICKKNEQFQKEVTTQHRQRLDNATLANIRMIKIQKLSGYGAKEPVFPGKMWLLDSLDQVETFQLGEIYPSSFSNEQATLIYSQQRTGVNETTLGMPQVGTPGTATGDLARIQEGNKKFDFIYQNFTEFTNDCLNDIFANIHQFGPRRLEYFEIAENGKKVQQFLELPSTPVQEGLVIKLKATNQQQNKILERQNWVQLAQLLQQYYTGLLQLAVPTGNQELVQLITTKGMWAATEAMRQILEAFDTRNIERIIVHEFEEMLNANRTGALPGGNGGPPGLGQGSPMDFLAQAIPGAGAAGNGTANRFSGPI